MFCRQDAGQTQFNRVIRMSQDQTQLARRPAAPTQTARAAPTVSASGVSTDHLTGAQKAAIIVRVLLAEGVQTPVSALPPDMQATLTQTLGSMRLVDRATMLAVVEEFIQTLEQVGVSFPDGLEAALSLLGGSLDANATRQLRALTRGNGQDDPWTALDLASDDTLLAILRAESQVVGAVLLSKLGTDKAARLLHALPADQASALALGIARTADIAPGMVARIGATLAEQINARPPRAFVAPPGKRMGEILNAATATLRDDLLAQIAQGDQGYADGVRQAIFTFHDIPDRLAPGDVPALMRAHPPEDMVTLIAAARPEDSAAITFLLDNMSKRGADALRDDAEAVTRPDARTVDAAMNAIAARIRSMANAEEITLRTPDSTGET